MDEEPGAPSHGVLLEEDARVETPRLSARNSASPPTVGEQIEAQVPLLSLGWSAADEEKLKRDEQRIQRLSELLDEREDRRREAVLVSLLERDRARAPLAPDTPAEGYTQRADHFAVPNICARTWESSSSPRAAEAVRVAWEGGTSNEEAEALPERRAPAALPIHQPPAAAHTPYRAVHPPSDTFEWVARSRPSTAPPHSFSSSAADPMEYADALRPSSLEDVSSADSFEAYLEELRLSARRAFERAPASMPLRGARHRTSALPPAIRARSPKDAADAIEAAAIAARLPSRSSAAQLEQRLRLELQVHEAMGQLERRVNEAHRLHADLGSNMHAEAVREVYALSSARGEEAEGAGIALLRRQLEAQQREHRERIAQIHSLGLASSVSGAVPVPVSDRVSSGREDASLVEVAVGEIGDEVIAHLVGELGGEVGREAMRELIGEVAGGLIGELLNQVTDELAREEVESHLAAATGTLAHAPSNEESRASKSGSHSTDCEGGITPSRAPSENGVSTHEPLVAALPGALEARRYSPADEAARGKPGALRLLLEGPPEQGDAVRYEVSVPAGVAPGSSFLASVGGRTVRVPVPLGIDPLVSLVIEMEPQPGLWVVDVPERAREGDSFHVALAGEVRLVTVPGVGVEGTRRAGVAMPGVGLAPQRLTRRSRGARLSRVAYESESDGESRDSSGSSGESWTHAWAPRAASASEASVHAAPSIERELLRVLLEERQSKDAKEAELTGKVLSRISEQAQNTLSWSDIRQQEAAAEREAHKQLRALKAQSRKQVRHAEREILRSLARRKAELLASQGPPAQSVDTLPTFRRDGTVLTDVSGDVEQLADVEPPACDGTLRADATDAGVGLEAASQGSTLRQASESRDDDALAISSRGGDDALDAAAAAADASGAALNLAEVVSPARKAGQAPADADFCEESVEEEYADSFLPGTPSLTMREEGLNAGASVRSVRSVGSVMEEEGLNTGASMRSMRSVESVMEDEGLNTGASMRSMRSVETAIEEEGLDFHQASTAIEESYASVIEEESISDGFARGGRAQEGASSVIEETSMQDGASVVGSDIEIRQSYASMVDEASIQESMGHRYGESTFEKESRASVMEEYISDYEGSEAASQVLSEVQSVELPSESSIASELALSELAPQREVLSELRKQLLQRRQEAQALLEEAHLSERVQKKRQALAAEERELLAQLEACERIIQQSQRRLHASEEDVPLEESGFGSRGYPPEASIAFEAVAHEDSIADDVGEASGMAQMLDESIGMVGEDSGAELVESKSAAAAAEESGVDVSEEIGVDVAEESDMGVVEESEMGVGEESGMGVGEESDMGVGEESGMGVGEESGMGVGEESGMGVGEESGMGVGEESFMGVGEESGMGVGEESGMGVVEESAMGVGEESAMGVVEESGMGIAEESGAVPEESGVGVADESGVRSVMDVAESVSHELSIYSDRTRSGSAIEESAGLLAGASSGGGVASVQSDSIITETVSMKAGEAVLSSAHSAPLSESAEEAAHKSEPESEIDEIASVIGSDVERRSSRYGDSAVYPSDTSVGVGGETTARAGVQAGVAASVDEIGSEVDIVSEVGTVDEEDLSVPGSVSQPLAGGAEESISAQIPGGSCLGEESFPSYAPSSVVESARDSTRLVAPAEATEMEKSMSGEIGESHGSIPEEELLESSAAAREAEGASRALRDEAAAETGRAGEGFVAGKLEKSSGALSVDEDTLVKAEEAGTGPRDEVAPALTPATEGTRAAVPEHLADALTEALLDELVAEQMSVVMATPAAMGRQVDAITHRLIETMIREAALIIRSQAGALASSRAADADSPALRHLEPLTDLLLDEILRELLLEVRPRVAAPPEASAARSLPKPPLPQGLGRAAVPPAAAASAEPAAHDEQSRLPPVRRPSASTPASGGAELLTVPHPSRAEAIVREALEAQQSSASPVLLSDAIRSMRERLVSEHAGTAWQGGGTSHGAGAPADVRTRHVGAWANLVAAMCNEALTEAQTTRKLIEQPVVSPLPLHVQLGSTPPALLKRWQARASRETVERLTKAYVGGSSRDSSTDLLSLDDDAKLKMELKDVRELEVVMAAERHRLRLAVQQEVAEAVLLQLLREAVDGLPK